MNHILAVSQFERPEIDEILARSEQMRQVAEAGGDQRLAGKILATIFYEPSTRTRLSFESAMFRAGGQVISAEMAAETSSAAKGESIEDTVRIVQSYAHAIVIRHPQGGAANIAASVAEVPIINAGDGAREHPTQALLDIYTIKRELGRIDDLTVALVGDLRYGRAARSLALLLTKTTGGRVLLVSPPEIRMADDVLVTLDAAGLGYQVEEDLATAMSQADVVYMTRVQKERFPDLESYQAVQGAYQLTTEHMAHLPTNSVLMHPLPRVDEIDPDIDADPRAAYFRQAQNGVYVRMALLDMLLGQRGLVA
jgi:aspartate carbamoyltransferase catalytic subunit